MIMLNPRLTVERASANALDSHSVTLESSHKPLPLQNLLANPILNPAGWHIFISVVCVCVCVCVCACVHACVRAYVCVCVYVCMLHLNNSPHNIIIVRTHAH